jgi:hypothetical protein
MESHSPAPALRQNQISSERNEGQAACELCPRLSGLEKIAERKYASWTVQAQRSDDAQEVYDPLATNFIRASDLAMRAVLRSTQRSMDQA